MSDLAKRLRNWTTDWDGSKMVPGEPPKDGLHCDIIDEAAEALERLAQENEALTKAGICEVAARNPRVMEYMRHWEARAEAAEARVAELEAGREAIARAALERAAEVADRYHAAALEWAKNVRGLNKEIDQTDSSRIAADIRAIASGPAALAEIVKGTGE